MVNVIHHTIGDNGDYTTITGWEVATRGDLVTQDRAYIGLLQNSYSGLSSIQIGPSTTDVDRYRQLTSSDIYLHDDNTGTLLTFHSGAFHGGEDYFVLGPGLGITVTGSSVEWTINLSGVGTTVDGLTLVELTGNGIYLTGTNGTGAVANTLIYGTGFATGIYTESGNYAYNCTVYSRGGSVGVARSTAINTVSFATTCFSDSITTSCASSDGTASGSLSGISLIHQFVNTTTGTENFNIKSDQYSDISNAAQSIRLLTEPEPEYTGVISAFQTRLSNLLNSDLAGSQRSQTPDIGALEFVSSQSALTNNITGSSIGWYLSEFNPNNLTGIIGGSVSQVSILSGPIDLIPSISGGTGFYLRKVFAQITTAGTLYYPSLYLDNVEYQDYISIAKEKVSGDTTTGSVYPNGYSGADFITPYSYEDGLKYSSMTSGDLAGVWIKFTVDDTTDPYAGFMLTLKGTSE